MMEPQPEQINNTIEHRRRGGAYDTLAKIFRNVNTIMFGTYTVVNDRPGVQDPSQVANPNLFAVSRSVFEIFQQKDSAQDEVNLMYLGRKGTGRSRYTNQLLLSANAKSTDTKIGNGLVGLELSRDGVVYSNSQISLYETSNYSGVAGARALINGEGPGGGVQLSYYDASGNFLYAFVLDVDGIQLYGLPTSNPGGSNKIWSDGGTLKIT